MNRSTHSLALGVVVTAAFAGPASAGAPRRLAVLELFTSQGCSSCPPADRLLSELAREHDPEVVLLPLAFHVDYWNYIGWTDPFSSPHWSERQRAYASALGANVYTPQLVINGSAELVGSDEKGVRRLLKKALAEAPLAALEVALGPAAPGPLLAVSVTARLPADTDLAPLELYVALYETDLVTEVTRGENARRSLHNENVVRLLEKAAWLETPDGAPPRATLEFALKPGWQRERLGVVALLQHRESRRIVAAGSAHLP